MDNFYIMIIAILYNLHITIIGCSSFKTTSSIVKPSPRFRNYITSTSSCTTFEIPIWQLILRICTYTA